MKTRKTLIALLMATTTTATAQLYLNPEAPLEHRVEDALQRMTIHEKIKMLHAQSKFTSPGVPRLGIRQLNMDDGPHGVREELEWNSWRVAGWTNDSVVAFPSLTCLAATWNRDLAAAYGHAVSEEFAYRGKDIMLGPGVNIQRTPLNGRAFEYMGEDPVLAAEIVVPYIQAAQLNGVGCCLKHFVLNDQETDRFTVNVNVDERALREIYLYPFEQAVKRANVYTIMGSYNLWKDVHCCQNDELLNKILKKEWKWDGAVISDWGGTTNTMEAAMGGLDIEMGTYTDGKLKESAFTYDDYYMGNPLEKLVNEWKVPMKVIDDKVRRVLRTIFRTAMNPRKVTGSLCSDNHYATCKDIAEEGIVLLKNSGLLPIAPAKYNRILVVGENATRSLTKGGGSSELKTLRDSEPLAALRRVWGKKVDYAQGYTSGRALYDKVDRVDASEQELLRAEAMEKARKADLIIFIGGLNKNHRQDCENGDRESYDLSFGQNELISALAKIQKNIVVVTFGGNPYATPWLKQVGGLMNCWYLGSESGTALTRVLTGEVNPSGKLPVTFAERYEDYPYVKYGESAYPGIDKQVTYHEGIFVGYRGFEKDKTKPLFPFGFGLSYTKFEYGKATVKRSAEGWTVSINVTNSGKRAGKETVQLYVGEEKVSRENPVKQLKNFEKVALRPGQTTTVTMTVNKNDLRSWDDKTRQWVMPTDGMKVYVGASAADIRSQATLN